ncbi:ATP/GTP-binding protein [Streptomyces sp. TM32]|uniref:ATP-binding protein n=1 Tax=Streptomyces sp. TM32 TaxID=1652669 RepID=UPI0010139B35|nr:ATP-binding protein [Streptomyces sp. TM32]RXS81487.1 ATP/GTP-binding protein [Streptomyces sp. TM32]
MSKPSPSRTPDTAGQAPPDSPLTTKEGWRHFVGHEPVPPALLTAAQRSAMSRTERLRQEEQRREYHADLPMVNTPTIRKVIATSRLLIQLNRNQISARRGVILSGASGTGKTTALTQLGRAHELAVRKRHPREVTRLPVLYVTVPPAATPKMLAMEFARFFGLTFPTRVNVTDIVDAVCATAAHVHVDLVLLDELHNLNLATRSGAEASDQLKYFAERLPATFAYAGIDIESQGVFAGTRGRQIAGRFVVIPAAQFSHATEADQDAWRALVGTLESMLRLHEHTPGALAGLSEYLFHRTGGMIGSLSQLIRGAAVLAIEDGSERITEDLLDIVPIDYAAEQSGKLSAPVKPSARRRRAA